MAPSFYASGLVGLAGERITGKCLGRRGRIARCSVPRKIKINASPLGKFLEFKEAWLQRPKDVTGPRCCGV